MAVVRRAERRRVETPNAVMTTFASPTQGGSGHSLWEVRMEPGSAGPEHLMTTEQLWTVVDGAATIVREGQPTVLLGLGDTAVLPGGCLRRVVADERAGLVAFVAGSGDARAMLADGTDRGTPDWIA